MLLIDYCTFFLLLDVFLLHYCCNRRYCDLSVICSARVTVLTTTVYEESHRQGTRERERERRGYTPHYFVDVSGRQSIFFFRSSFGASERKKNDGWVSVGKGGRRVGCLHPFPAVDYPPALLVNRQMCAHEPAHLVCVLYKQRNFGPTSSKKPKNEGSQTIQVLSLSVCYLSVFFSCVLFQRTVLLYSW